MELSPDPVPDAETDVEVAEVLVSSPRAELVLLSCPEAVVEEVPPPPLIGTDVVVLATLWLVLAELEIELENELELEVVDEV